MIPGAAGGRVETAVRGSDALRRARDTSLKPTAVTAAGSGIGALSLADAVNRIASNQSLVENPDIGLLLASLKGTRLNSRRRIARERTG